MESIADRFWAKVDTTGECWEWTGYCNPDGYGKFWFESSTYSHRVSWFLEYGEIPDGLSVLHKCDNPPCVRPDHLFLGTQLDNMRDSATKGRWTPRTNRYEKRTHCAHGHEYTKESTYRRKSTGCRVCRVCGRISDAARRKNRAIKTLASPGQSL